MFSGILGKPLQNAESNAEADVRRCSSKLLNIHRKTPVLGSSFNNTEDLRTCNFIKKHQTIKRFLTFSEGIETEHWPQMD